MTCPYYATHVIVLHSPEIGNPQSLSNVIPHCMHPICEHLALSRVSKVVGGGTQLRCGGDMAKCQATTDRQRLKRLRRLHELFTGGNDKLPETQELATQLTVFVWGPEVNELALRVKQDHFPAGDRAALEQDILDAVNRLEQRTNP